MALKTQLMLPIALGFSLVTVTAFVVYYVFKKEEENTDKNIRSTKVNIIEVQVPKSIVPALIDFQGNNSLPNGSLQQQVDGSPDGKSQPSPIDTKYVNGRNGSNIKQIEHKSGAMIHFKKFSDKEYDVCIIRGRSNTTQVAETLIHDFIKQQPVIVEDSMAVPGWACGRIIGTGGENINDISHRSGARVKLEGQKGVDLSMQRQVSFRGTAEQIAVAKSLIESCVEQEKCRREIEQSKRSPRVAQPSPPPADTGDPPQPKHAKYTAHETNGSSIEVYVSAVSSPSRFWVQFVGPQVTQLDELVAHMTEYYSNRDNRAAHSLQHVAVGQVVAAVFRHDGRWYRARVHDIRPNEFDATQQVADVFYLDYGDSEYVATHELCELRADLLRLRFQAMECFLAGVKPAGKDQDANTGLTWPKWDPQAVERFEELTQVARWKPLVSRTCTYKRTATGGGENEKEIPGIKLYDVTDEGELDIAAALVAEGWAVESAALPPAHPHTPFGDLTSSRVLGMLDPSSGTPRASSMPKDHKNDSDATTPTSDKENQMLASKSLSSGLEAADKVKSISNFDLSYPDSNKLKLDVNGSHDFLSSERQENELPGSPTLPKTPLDDIKANINRIDSHHSSLEALGRH